MGHDQATCQALFQQLLSQKSSEIDVLRIDIVWPGLLAQNLIDLIRECGSQGITVAVARLESLRAQEAFERFRLYDVLPRDRVFHSVAEAIAALAA